MVLALGGLLLTTPSQAVSRPLSEAWLTRKLGRRSSLRGPIPAPCPQAPGPSTPLCTPSSFLPVVRAQRPPCRVSVGVSALHTPRGTGRWGTPDRATRTRGLGPDAPSVGLTILGLRPGPLLVGGLPEGTAGAGLGAFHRSRRCSQSTCWWALPDPGLAVRHALGPAPYARASGPAGAEPPDGAQGPPADHLAVRSRLHAAITPARRVPSPPAPHPRQGPAEQRRRQGVHLPSRCCSGFRH